MSGAACAPKTRSSDVSPRTPPIWLQDRTRLWVQRKLHHRFGVPPLGCGQLSTVLLCLAEEPAQELELHDAGNGDLEILVQRVLAAGPVVDDVGREAQAREVLLEAFVKRAVNTFGVHENQSQSDSA